MAYCVLDPVQTYTRQQCRRADLANARLHRESVRLVQKHQTPGVDAGDVMPLPAMTNEARLDVWLRQNAPVRADVQTAAVFALASAGVWSPAHYEPQDAVAEAARRGLGLVAAPADTTTGYEIWTDDELLRRSHRDCERADARNQLLFRRRHDEVRKTRERLASVTSTSSTGPDPPLRSNVAQRARLQAQSMMVSAVLQTAAVQHLTRCRRRPGVDYEPQNAIRTAERTVPIVPSVPIAPIAPPAWNAPIAPPPLAPTWCDIQNHPYLSLKT